MFLQDLLRKKSDTLGLDIGNRIVKLVRITRGKENLVSFCGKLEANPADSDFSKVLREYLAKHNLLGMGVAASLDDPSLKIRKLELPEMPETDLKEAVKWK